MIDKTYLISHIILLEEIGIQEEHLQEIIEEITNIPARNNDGMPRGTAKENDRIADRIEMKESIENKLNELKMRAEEEKKIIEGRIKATNIDAIESQLMYLRYICGYDWGRVQRIMYMNKYDYYTKEQSYKRKMFRVHKKALEKMKIL